MNKSDESLKEDPKELEKGDISSLPAQGEVLKNDKKNQLPIKEAEVSQSEVDNPHGDNSNGVGSSPKNKKEKKKAVTSGKRVIGLMLPSSFMVYRVAANFPELAANDSLLLQTRNGEVVGRVVYISSGPPERSIDPERLFPGRITRIIRKLSKSDVENIRKNSEIEQKAKLVCRQAIRELKLPMKLAKVTYQQKGSKILFHFTSEGRVDFRELVRLLGTKLKNRIEMRHVGVRDETRLLSGVGPCGKELCCSQYLQKFHPVSVRMAKNQDLSLNPDGISGVCGRLLCCLAYENDTYVELKKGLPKIKKCCWTKGGKEATVKNVHTLSGMVTLQHKDGTYETLPASDISKEKPEFPEVQPDSVQYNGSDKKPVKSDKASFKNKKNTKKPAAQKEVDKEKTAETPPSKSSKKRRSRRRRKGRVNKEGSEQNVVQNSQPKPNNQTSDTNVNSGSKPPPNQDNKNGEVKTGEAGSKGDGTKKRRRRRRKRGNRSGGEKPNQPPTSGSSE
jgi:cell fate regulator YaaT (PSP1 superfamily)